MAAICTVFVYFISFYLTVLFACMICFYYNVCDCHTFIKGNLLIYLPDLKNELGGHMVYLSQKHLFAGRPPCVFDIFMSLMMSKL